VRLREPFPYCGATDAADPDSPDLRVAACFLDAVLAGRPAEAIHTVYGTEGGSITQLDRFAGTGAVVRFEREGHAPWTRRQGLINLGATRDIDPLPE
jgi:hypothetical protein